MEKLSKLPKWFLDLEDGIDILANLYGSNLNNNVNAILNCVANHDFFILSKAPGSAWHTETHDRNQGTLAECVEKIITNGNRPVYIANKDELLTFEVSIKVWLPDGSSQVACIASF
jgi:hypothetical protein